MTGYFSDTYQEARKALLDRASAAGGWEHEAIAHPQKGPDGQPIYVDILRRGPADAERILTISSGTHGAEGFCGSALQSWFVDVAPALPENTAVVLVHAVNPYGFAHVRRVNEDNVDLNRNFIDFSKGRPENDAYAEIFDLLNPREWSDETPAAIEASLKRVQAATDPLQFMKMISGGQYDFADGMQFGGFEPAWSRRTIEDVWQRYLGTAKIVVQIDIHTGLGEDGVGVLMMAANDDEPHKAITAGWLGPMMVTSRPRNSEETILGGYMNGGVEQQLDAWVIPMTLEYGTRPSIEVLIAMIGDNWLVHHGEIDSPQGRAIKERLLRAFYPDDDAWREKVMVRGEDVITKCLTGLGELDPNETPVKETTR